MSKVWTYYQQTETSDRKVRRQGKYFSTGLPYANRMIVEIWMSMVNITYNSTEDMINKLQEDLFSKIAQGLSKIYDEFFC